MARRAAKSVSPAAVRKRASRARLNCGRRIARAEYDEVAIPELLIRMRYLDPNYGDDPKRIDMGIEKLLAFVTSDDVDLTDALISITNRS